MKLKNQGLTALLLIGGCVDQPRADAPPYKVCPADHVRITLFGPR